ncbi:MAG: hypothetical protein KDA76_00335 [Planctomycetaceae bacterium]|nr:hypothetical protein [Planctomycetaceae bacterium]
MRAVYQGLRVCLLLASFGGFAEAQDYRIYTRVSLAETTNSGAKANVIGRSLTIWHAGKVYDYMDSVGELVIYDPQQERYTIINGPCQLACTVDFSELRHYLKVAKTQAREFMAELAESNRPDSTRAIEKIAFQLEPRFEMQFLDAEFSLQCESPHLSYQIQAIEAPNTDIAAAFRIYADLAAQLNFVLHGQSLMPEARMQVNEALEQKNWIPTQVVLSLKDPRGTVLTAEHSIQWELGSTDRARLIEWIKLQQEGDLKFVSFQEYQRNLLTQFSEK